MSEDYEKDLDNHIEETLHKLLYQFKDRDWAFKRIKEIVLHAYHHGYDDSSRGLSYRLKRPDDFKISI